MASLRVVALALLIAAGSIGDVCAQDPQPGKSATPAGEPWAVPAELLLGQPDTPSHGPDYRWRGPGYRWDPPVRPNDYKFLPRFSGR